MIGNDVVDLRDPEAQPEALHPRFDARVFARAERRALAASGAPARLRWILWAAKEAAYKVARKLDGAAIFSPRRFVVELDARLRGSVEHEGQRYEVWVQASPDCVHAVASGGPLPSARCLSRVVELAEGADPGAELRALARRDVAPLIGALPEALHVGRRGRIPVLEVGEAPADVDLSLSHHGRYAAWACELGAGAPLP